MTPPRSPRCPRCGFSFAWDGRKCRHCPPPARARRLWEQVARLSELVGSDKGITQRQLLLIAAGCLRRVANLLPERARDSADLLDRDPERIARDWGRDAVRHLFMTDPEQLALTGLRLLACEVSTAKTLSVPTVQTACAHWARGVSRKAVAERVFLSFPLPAELEPHRAAVAAALATGDGPNVLTSRKQDDPVRVAYEYLAQQVDETDRERWRRSQAEEAAQCDVARDVLGYPEATVNFSPEWRTSTAVAMARGMSESRDFFAMPILADALQDAGCDDPEVLEHCRGEKPHFRGCWVIEHLLRAERHEAMERG